jgi:hypothetical protein
MIDVDSIKNFLNICSGVHELVKIEKFQNPSIRNLFFVPLFKFLKDFYFKNEKSLEGK